MIGASVPRCSKVAHTPAASKSALNSSSVLLTPFALFRGTFTELLNFSPPMSISSLSRTSSTNTSPRFFRIAGSAMGRFSSSSPDDPEDDEDDERTVILLPFSECE
eukprot:CAMPEP_0119195370 /NCGR_PEP_ID=MMETSP1316-20130426/5774_1 /TAXON_ID=41880 /ORGANISM="Pycnococcus provasolii, Strain RCC2336" /LENGTH=105 /DNA_ID=CAMNT_0007190859 /DNA_START=153 /DNA_END=470 /DNA_ORIENTATION=+